MNILLGKSQRFTLCVFLLAAAVPLCAQVASITGLVTDPAGAIVPGAMVAAVNTQTNITSTTVTTSEGYYTLRQLPPGSYELKVEKAGFSPLSRTGIAITVGQVVRADMQMQIAGVASTVQVEAAAALLESEPPRWANWWTTGASKHCRCAAAIPMRW